MKNYKNLRALFLSTVLFGSSVQASTALLADVPTDKMAGGHARVVGAYQVRVKQLVAELEKAIKAIPQVTAVVPTIVGDAVTDIQVTNNAAATKPLTQHVADLIAANGGGGGGGHAPVDPNLLAALGITALRDDGGTLKAKFNAGEKTLAECIQDVIAAETAKVAVKHDALAAEGLTRFNVQAGVPKVTRAKAIGGGTEEVDLVTAIHDLRTPAQVLPAAFMASVQPYIALTDSAKTRAFVIAGVKACVAKLPDGDIVDQANLAPGTVLKTKVQLATLLETRLGALSDDRFLFADPAATVNLLSLAAFVDRQKTFLSSDLEAVLVSVIAGKNKATKQLLNNPSTTARGLRDNLLAAIFA